MKSNRHFKSILIFCILFSTLGQSHAQQYSHAFQALLNQIQQNYLAQKGDNLSSLRNRYPTVVATLIGNALRQQMVHVLQNPSLNNQFTNLQREARIYIEEVARTTTARLVDGSRFNPEDLWNMVNGALQGGDDGWILETFGVRTGTMPPVLAAGPEHRPLPPPVGAPLTKEEKNQIELLGKAAPSVKGPPKETPAPPPPRKITLKPDGIQGIWYSEGVGGSAQLRVWKEGDTYLGMLTNRQGTTSENWRRNEVCLRLKYVGQHRQDNDILVFKGKHNRQVGNVYENHYEWQDKTSYYRLMSGGVEAFGAYPYSIVESNFRRNPH
jgi:hypothetical protein